MNALSPATGLLSAPANPGQSSNSSPWAIIIVVVIAVILLGVMAVTFMRKRR